MLTKIFPPWSADQIAALQAHQDNGKMHPYTCVCSGENILTPTREGWVCPRCGYQQKWAYDSYRPSV